VTRQKKVLIVTYYFPPLGGVGVQRVSKFTKYLPEFDWSPVVVAPEPTSFYMTDEGMLDDVKNAEIHRIAAPDSFRAHQRMTGRDKPKIDSPARRLARNFVWPDTHKGFTRKALPVIKGLSAGVEVIFATAPPWSNLLIVPGLKAETGLPVVVDMRDPWVKHPVHDRPQWKSGKNRTAERKSLESADAVIAATRAHEEDLRERYPGLAGKVHYIPNGYDKEDFSGKKRKRRDNHLTIVYTGILGLEDINEGSTLYEALRILKNEDGLTPEELRFEIIGEVSKKEEERMRVAEEFIERQGFLSHKETMLKLEQADLAYLPYHAEYSKLIVPAKTYEYVGSGTPILAEVDSNHETASIVKDTGTGMVVEEGDVEDIIDALRLLISGRFPYRSKRKQIRFYDRSSQTETLANILNEIT